MGLEGAPAAEQASDVNRADIYKAIAISGAVSVLAGILDHEWVEAHEGLAMGLLFCLGYIGIFVEELLGLNKAGIALVMAVSLWTVRSGVDGQVDVEISAALANVSELIFFLLGAMTVVEVVDAHGGFRRVSAGIRADQRSTLTWLLAGITFCMSGVLDNLTTTIVMISILQRVAPADVEFRRLLGAIVVIAANAGGAWTPIGDVTTTMLWIHGQITPWVTMRDLLLPSLVSVAVPVAMLVARTPELQGPVSRPDEAAALHDRRDSNELAASSSRSGSALQVQQQQQQHETLNRDVLVLAVGVGTLLFVPVFRQLTGLPPWCGMLSGLGVLWMMTDSLHFGESKTYPRVQDALRSIDISGVMFFQGILLSVEALNAAGLLVALAEALDRAIPNKDIIAGVIGLVSAVIDNVPLVAATMGMYDISQVPQDSQLWQLIALCAGTGGSLLVIGSAAGVAYMGLEGVGFGWYVRRVSGWALMGYAAAIATFVVMHGLPSSGGVI